MEKAKSRGLIEIRDWGAGKVEKGNCVYLFANVAFHDVPVSPVSRMFAGTLCIGMACTRCLWCSHSQLNAINDCVGLLPTTAFVSLNNA
jgi:hypothetical protein